MLLLGIAGGAGPDLAGWALCCLACPGVPMLIWLVGIALIRDSLPAAGFAVLLPAGLGALVAYVTATTHPDPADPEQVMEHAEAWNTVWVCAAIATAVAVCVVRVPLRRMRRWYSRGSPAE